MPCYNSSSDDEARDNVKKIKFFEAALCAILTVDRNVLAKVDWKAAGISDRDVKEWYAEHKRKDAMRWEQEAAFKRKDRIKKNALQKLTEEELRALGIFIKNDPRNLR